MTIHDRLQLTLGDGYTLERELGGGGMSRVFVAVDHSLGRAVVVKLLEPDAAGGVSVDRFAREIKVAATLQHPCIVPVLTSGDANGLPYYTMPLVEGQSLRQRISVGTLPIAEIIRILRDVASALACAHSRGIVHRDIKPENVLLSGGYAMVTDFGIAKALSAATTNAGGNRSATLTQVGMALGTPQYMAPEQISGDPDVDRRADIYSFGCVAYELLTGQSPFGNRSYRQLVIAHLGEVPRPVAELRTDAPSALADMVTRCLAKEPADRPQRAEDLIAALDRASTVTTPTARPATVIEPVVAVLPFTNLSSDPENEYLSDGISEEVIGTLARTEGIRAIGRGSSFAFKRKDVDPRDAAKQLGAAYVVVGSVRKAGNKIRVGAELVNAADGLSLWSARFDREITDIFAVQDEIAGSIATALRSKFFIQPPEDATAGVPSAAKPDVTKGEAYALYLRGSHLFRNQGMQGGNTKAIALFDQALAIDPTLARAHIGKGLVYNVLAVWCFAPPHEVMPKALAAARAALAIDPEFAQAHMLVGYVAASYEWDWAKADRSFSRALQLEPEDPFILNRAAVFETARGRFDAAIAHSMKAIEADRLDVWSLYIATTVFFGAGQYQEAVHFAEAALELNPQHGESMRNLGWALWYLGRVDEAYDVAVKAASVSNRNPFVVLLLGRVHQARGEIAAARSCVEELLARREREYVSGSAIAPLLWILGDRDTAMKWLETSVEERDWMCFLWRSNFMLDESMRGDRRVQELIRRIGIPG
ncbi:MAG: protein kinase domain-containing protein [Thermoanaerobaculia bacterium]